MDREKEKKIDEILKRGVIKEIIPTKKEFKKRLLTEKLKIYIGADPTFTSLHLGHAQNYLLLEDFRQLGHEVIVLFGDFTAQIGDPTDKESARKQLNVEEVRNNVKDWIRQIKPLLNFEDKKNPPKIVYNNDWLAKLTLKDVVDLASNITVQRMLERDMFEKRIKEEKPIYLHEFMYPLMQGYDSVAMDVDVELCGSDQIFNALMGRTLQKKYRNKNKLVVATNLVANPISGELMSKSKGTGIFLDNSAFDMYGAIMSQPDEMIEVLLISDTRLPLDEIKKITKMNNPRDAKMKTAWEITKIFHGEKGADEAEERFIKLVQKKETADNVPEVKLNKFKISLIELLKECLKNEISNSQIKRLIEQNSIKIDGDTKNNCEEEIKISKEGILVKVGKKKWFKVLS